MSVFPDYHFAIRPRVWIGEQWQAAGVVEQEPRAGSRQIAAVPLQPPP